MTNPSGDNPELENLFNEVLKREHPEINTHQQENKTQEVKEEIKEEKKSSISEAAMASGDSPELQDLFDELHTKFEQEHSKPSSQEKDQHPKTPVKPEGMSEKEADMFSKIGRLTRQLHDTMRQLGIDESLERVSHAIPDAKDRLEYVVSMSESAAKKVLDATEKIQPLQGEIETQAKNLAVEWEKAFENKISTEEFKNLSQETFKYLQFIPQKTQETNNQVLDIVMAQDFQDLTGQVIKRILDMIQALESSLVGFLLEYSPESLANKPQALENGPVINKSDPEVVTNQQQVDDLLESLGF